MAADTKESTQTALGDLAQGMVNDVERLVSQHLQLLRSEMKESLEDAKEAAASLAVGAGAGVAAGMMGLLASVHLLNRTTRLPLWASFGFVGAVLGSVSAGFLTAGVRKASEVELVPRQTAEALREDFTGSHRRTAVHR